MNNTPHNIRRSSSDFTIMKGLGLLGQCNVPELSGIVDFEWFLKIFSLSKKAHKRPFVLVFFLVDVGEQTTKKEINGDSSPRLLWAG